MSDSLCPRRCDARICERISAGASQGRSSHLQPLHLQLDMATRRWACVAVVALLASSSSVYGIGQDTCVTFKSSSSAFTLVNNGKAAPILLSSDEWPGVQRAAFDFASDIQQVTGVKPSLSNISTSDSSFSSVGSTAIIVGTLGKSSLIDGLVNRTKLDVSSIQGKWEAFLTTEVANPLPGVKSAYVIIGADKRGTIFALYDHSEQFGAWYIVLGVDSILTRCSVMLQVFPRGIGEHSNSYPGDAIFTCG